MNQDVFNISNIFLNSNLNDQNKVFAKIAKISIKNTTINLKDAKQLITELENREKISSTALGQYIAIPHCRSNIIQKPSVIFIRTKNQISWNGLNQKPVKIIIALLAPLNEATTIHMELLSDITSKLIDEDIRNILQTTNDKNEIINVLLADKIILKTYQ